MSLIGGGYSSISYRVLARNQGVILTSKHHIFGKMSPSCISAFVESKEIFQKFH